MFYELECARYMEGSAKELLEQAEELRRNNRFGDAINVYRAAAEEPGFRVVCNDRPEDGVSRTIRLGLQAAEACGGALFMTADQPLLTAETLRKLTERFMEQPQYIYAAAHDGVRGNPCLFPKEFFEELCALQGDTGGAAVIRKHPERLRLPCTRLWRRRNGCYVSVPPPAPAVSLQYCLFPYHLKLSVSTT